jgi:hypothetical protein
VEAIAGLPMLNDIDAGYSPSTSSSPASSETRSSLASTSTPTPCPLLTWRRSTESLCGWHGMRWQCLAANRYVSRSGPFAPYRVTWQGS